MNLNDWKSSLIKIIFNQAESIYALPSIRLNENGLVALALLIAESNPSHKEMMIRLILNLLID